MATQLYEEDAIRKLIKLEHYLTRNFRISSYEAHKINRYVRRQFVTPHAIRRASTNGRVVAFPYRPVEKHGKSPSSPDDNTVNAISGGR